MLDSNQRPNDSTTGFICTRPTCFPPADVDLSIMEVGHVIVPEGMIYPKTTTSFCTLAWCVDGQLIFEGSEWALHANKNELIVADCNLNFTTRAGPEGCEAYYLLMDGPKMNKLLSSENLWTGTFPYSELPVRWLLWLAERIQDETQYSTLASTGYSLFQDVPQQAEKASPDPLVWKALCYLQNNWNQPTTNVESVLHYLQVSRSTLSPRFKKQLGCTIKERLYNIRYQHALRMLKQDAVPIATIAERCGFMDPAHFSAWFKKQSGTNPRSLKKKHS